MDMLFKAHSGVRYLILLAALILMVLALYGLATRKPVPSARGLLSAFTGLLDLQILLGAALMAGGIYYRALIGHMSMMVLAAIVAHLGSAKARKLPDELHALRVRFITVLFSTVLIIGGIMAIGRGIVGTSGPSQVATAETIR